MWIGGLFKGFSLFPCADPGGRGGFEVFDSCLTGDDAGVTSGWLRISSQPFVTLIYNTKCYLPKTNSYALQRKLA